MDLARKPLYPPSRSEIDAGWKRSFIRAATSVVLSKVRRDLGSPQQVLRANWPNDDRAAVITRGAVEPMKVGDFPGSSVVRLLQLAPKSAAAQLFPSATVIDLDGISQCSFPLASSFAAAGFIAEGAPIPLRQGVYQGFTVGPVRKLALISALSSEMESASGGIAEALTDYTLQIAVGRGMDGIMLSANAATEDAPAGLLLGLTPLAGSASMSADLSALIGEIAAAGIDTASVVFVCAPQQALSLSLLAGPHFTHRIIEASALAAGSVVAVAVAGLIVAGDGSIPQVDTSKQAVLHFADPASQIAPEGGPISAPVISTFQNDLLALRCTARVTWSAAPGSVAVLTGATW
jgi:hypothetical protein